MTTKNSNPNPDDDKALQEQADTTWASLESGDPLGQAIRDSSESCLPESNPQLRDLLSERLAMVGKESRIGKESSNSSSSTSRGRLIGWGIALSLALLLGAITWINSYRTTVALHSEVEIRERVQEAMAGELPEGLVIASEKVERMLRREQLESQLQLAREGSGAVEKFPASLPLVTKSKTELKSSRSRNRELQNIPGFRPEITSFDSYKASDFVFPGADEWRSKVELRKRWRSVNEPGPTDAEGQGDADGEGSFSYAYEKTSNAEQYDPIIENAFMTTLGGSALSTFSIDVDTASYANMRRFLNSGQRPPRNSVRIEELINYFHYDYPQPEGETPFSVNMEVATCPWNSQHRLLRVGLKGKEIHRAERPVSNLVFLLDVSGSMSDQAKLPLLKRGLKMMVDQLTENDRVSIVTYAGNAGLVLPGTSGDQKAKIHAAIDNLNSGGSTHGSAGIQLAYDLASENLIEGGTNRVIWATDGDLNVGVTGDHQLVDLVSGRAAEGVFLTVLGMGTGNLKDGKLEKIANKGNGMYAYIDSMQEARKVLVEQMSGSLVTIAKDVKLQIEFNPGEVAAYRLIGYENRMLETEDFDNDVIDAGEIGAGHTVTALYELVPAAIAANGSAPPTSLKYQAGAEKQAVAAVEKTTALTDAADSGELLTLALRYKMPESSESTKIDFTVKDSKIGFDEASSDFRFAASVASFGMLLRDSKYRGESTITGVEEMASNALGSDQHGYRAEFIDLVRRVK